MTQQHYTKSKGKEGAWSLQRAERNYIWPRSEMVSRHSGGDDEMSLGGSWGQSSEPQKLCYPEGDVESVKSFVLLDDTVKYNF